MCFKGYVFQDTTHESLLRTGGGGDHPSSFLDHSAIERDSPRNVCTCVNLCNQELRLLCLCYCFVGQHDATLQGINYTKRAGRSPAQCNQHAILAAEPHAKRPSLTFPSPLSTAIGLLASTPVFAILSDKYQNRRVRTIKCDRSCKLW